MAHRQRFSDPASNPSPVALWRNLALGSCSAGWPMDRSRRQRGEQRSAERGDPYRYVQRSGGASVPAREAEASLQDH